MIVGRAIYIAALVTGAATPASAAGTVTGQVRFEGEAPKPTALEATTDSAICSQQELVDESLIVHATTKGVRSVVVWIEGSKGGAKASAAPTIDNYRCRYAPHVVIGRVGEKITIRNRDRFLHTTQATNAKGNSLFNVALPIRNQAVKKSFKARGFYPLRCDVHPWMRGWAAILDDELAAVTDDTGKFTIAGLPAGSHKLRLWHETLGEKTVEITVGDGETKADLTWAK